MMSEKNIHAICKICPGEFTGCEMDNPDCWIVQGSFALDQVKALEAERDTLKELLKEGWRYKDDMLQWQEYRIWKKKVREFLGVDAK
jgi:hypothetical protein